jgi:hypothetical protein
MAEHGCVTAKIAGICQNKRESAAGGFEPIEVVSKRRFPAPGYFGNEENQIW